MIFGSFFAALGQLGDWRFLRVVMIGVALSLALLFGVYALFIQLIDWVSPEVLTLPFVGAVTWVKDLLGWGSLLLMIGLSIFLMLPVAALFSGLFLDDVAQAVEERHYPGLSPLPRRGLYDSLVGSVNFFGVLVAVNLLAFLLYGLVGPLAPVMFWAVNGYLLGREYFQTVAYRRMGRAEARALRKANAGTVWLAGALMVAPLSIPIVNLIIPVLGVATFTHIFHGIMGKGARALPSRSRDI